MRVCVLSYLMLAWVGIIVNTVHAALLLSFWFYRWVNRVYGRERLVKNMGFELECMTMARAGFSFCTLLPCGLEHFLMAAWHLDVVGVDVRVRASCSFVFHQMLSLPFGMWWILHKVYQLLRQMPDLRKAELSSPGATSFLKCPIKLIWPLSMQGSHEGCV